MSDDCEICGLEPSRYYEVLTAVGHRALCYDCMNAHAIDDGAEVATVPMLYADYVTDYLLSPVWKAKRPIWHKRAGHKCQLCGAPSAARRLEVHHNTYIRVFHEDITDCVVLCDDCHEWFHESRGLWEQQQRRRAA